ncbi:MAG: class I mannose-6-phosphate isomerase [Chloroflexota bacterium]|nr:class I mannose-6-phosphate isomerase [Chloroflexota bacterium]
MNTNVSLVTPRLDGKPWGGRKLGGYGLDLPPDGPVGEALVTAGDAIVSAGYMAGRTLGEIVEADPAAHLGVTAGAAVSGRAVFPLLVKLIDATENLSIQVHPNDAGAEPLDRLGKTEAWHVLEAEPGSVLYLGIRPGVEWDEFRQAAARLDGSSAPLMRTVPARSGTTVLIPAGTVHALGAGVVVYEVQQPSDVTYRLDDWGRVDAEGNPREVHLEVGFDVAQRGSIPELIDPVSLRPAIGERHLLAACRYFALERVALPAGGALGISHPGSPSVITLLQGAAKINGMTLEPGSSAVVWPSAATATLSATSPTIALVAYVPDIVADIVEPAMGAGADHRAIASLGGATGDLDRQIQP